MHVIIGFKHRNGVNNLLLLIFMTFRVSFRFDFFRCPVCRLVERLIYEKPKLIILNFTCHRYKFERTNNIFSFNSVFVP